MSPGVDRPREVLDVVGRYRRHERLASWLVAAVVVAAFLGVYAETSLLPAAAVGAGLVVLLRLPVYRPTGTARLRTDAPPDDAVDDFSGPTPPVLAFQWGVADEITDGDGEATYRVSYLLGLRSTEMAVRTRTATDADRRVELDVTAGGHPWATYEAAVREGDDHTVVDVEYAADRRFGLRRLPTGLIVRRHYEEALAAQGYTVLERDRNLAF